MPTPVDLTEEEATQFIAWRKYQNKFHELLEAGVFSIKGGKAIINFDWTGEIMQVSLDHISWKRK